MVNKEYFHAQFPQEILSLGLRINELELLTIMAAIKVWWKQLKGERFKINCDNTSAVAAMNNARMHNKFSQACMREIAYWAAIGEFEVQTVHIAGARDDLADALSRWHIDSSHSIKFKQLTCEMVLSEMSLGSSCFEFTGAWN